MSKHELPSDILALWSKRTSEFWREVRPYAGYALQSFSYAAILIMLAGGYFYTRLLSEAPPDFPFRETAALVLLPFLALSPVRTYIRNADFIYLLPMETKLSVYMHRAVMLSFWLQSFLLLAVWMAAWPMYAMAAGGSLVQFAHVLIMAILAKRVLIHGAWLELKLTERLPIILWSALRWIVAAAAALLLLRLPLWTGTLAVSAVLLVYLGALRLTSGKRILNWLRLADTEQRQRARIFRLLNYFIDVADIPNRPTPIRAPMKLLRGLGGFGYDSAHTYRYLFTLVWLRSELGGITMRLTVLGFLLIAWTRGDALAVFLFALFAGLMMLQLKELQKAYRHSDWSYIYPLPPELRMRSAATIRFRIHAACLLLLGVPLLWAMSHPGYALVTLCAGLALSYGYARWTMRAKKAAKKK
ncbi:ABC transporter permease [Paenibacillus elgii]|uniref:ABC transporter permease n=1 Tax=Paenibacillus elgii TaxID=189691 RepID=UPI000248D1AC|nr:ABC transporter permease [Paenibacillus elgii]